MKMLGVNLLLMCTAVLAQQGSRKETPSEQPVGLIELEATTRMVEGPIREGGYDDSFRIRRARYYVPDLLDCSDRIISAAKQWADTQHATTEKSETRPRRVLLHLVKPNMPGFYELNYHVDLDAGTARVTFFHYIGGLPNNPETESQSGVEKLVPMLKGALTCLQPSSPSSH